MKILKVLILSVIFFAASDVMAQNQVVVHNNTLENYTLKFNFATPCAPVNLNAPGPTVVAAPYCTGGTLVSFDISFTDNTCSPPQPVSVTVNYTSNPTSYLYTRCDGTIIHFNVHFNGIDYIMDIN